MSSIIKVAVLEDQQIIVDGYSYRLRNAAEFEIVGVADVYSDWEALLTAQAPDVALMDVKVPMALGNTNPYPILTVMPHLIESHPEMAFLVISAYPEPTLVKGVMEAGASGYILKDDNILLRELPDILRAVVASRGIYLSPQAKEQLLKRLATGGEISLSARQIQALSLCALYPECSTKDLATQMSITASTLRNLLSQAYLRLGVNGRRMAVLKAQELGLVSPATRP